MFACRVIQAVTLTACFASMNLRAESPTLQPALNSADPVAEAMFHRTGSTGLVLVVVRGSEVWMQTYGQTAPGSEQKPAPNSLLRLCSLSKILATDLLVKLVLDHTVAFTDPLQKFAPVNTSGDVVRVPMMTARGPAERGITLGDLATHTAGLPREIAYPPVGMAHFTFPDEAFRWQWLPKFRLRTSPGTSAHYSNIGFDLLGDALSHVSGKSYAQLFAERTARPLGLRDTTLAPTADQCSRLMGGAREPIQCTSTETAAGSGGMYSTAEDMAKLLRYMLDLPGVPVHQDGAARAVYLRPEQLHSVQGLGHAGVPTGIGLGWIEINGGEGDARIVEKTGGGAGFQTYIALNPAKRTGVFVAATQGRQRSGANLFRETNALLIQLAGLPPVPVDADDPERERSATEGREEVEVTPMAVRHRAAVGHVMPAAKRSSKRMAKDRKGLVRKTPSNRTGTPAKSGNRLPAIRKKTIRH